MEPFNFISIKPKLISVSVHFCLNTILMRIPKMQNSIFQINANDNDQ